MLYFVWLLFDFQNVNQLLIGPTCWFAKSYFSPNKLETNMFINLLSQKMCNYPFEISNDVGQHVGTLIDGITRRNFPTIS